MYDDTVENLRELQLLTENCENQSSCLDCKNKDLCDKYDNKTLGATSRQAADAIEELIEECDVYRKAMTDEHNRAAKLAWEKEHCWIPVTERLPEDGSDILAVQSYCGEVRIIPANYDRGVWYDCVFNRVAEHITHWMPLPPAPKEE